MLQPQYLVPHCLAAALSNSRCQGGAQVEAHTVLQPDGLWFLAVRLQCRRHITVVILHQEANLKRYAQRSQDFKIGSIIGHHFCLLLLYWVETSTWNTSLLILRSKQEGTTILTYKYKGGGGCLLCAGDKGWQLGILPSHIFTPLLFLVSSSLEFRKPGARDLVASANWYYVWWNHYPLFLGESNC